MMQNLRGNPLEPSHLSKSTAWTDHTLPPKYSTWRNEEQRLLLQVIQDGDYVADFCCGDGRLIKSILTKAEYYAGCDLDKEAIFLARETAKRLIDRATITHCDFMAFDPILLRARPSVAICMGNSLAALQYPLPIALDYMADIAHREIVASVIRKGTLEIRKDYYEKLGEPYRCDEETEVFHSAVWGESRAYSPDELEAGCQAAGLRLIRLTPVGELGLMITATQTTAESDQAQATPDLGQR